jgi:endonuclease/exonuclease/phosphatase family metal-dependent hydrolase
MFKPALTAVVSALLILAGSFTLPAQQITLATYNIRLQTTADSGNLWVNRAPMVSALIRFHGFDVFGTQEGFLNQLNDIKKNLPDFDFYGVGRDDGREAGEHCAIFYKKDRFTLLNKGDFWLSETPDQPSKGWDGKCCNRICTWVQLQDKQTGKKFYYFNAHFDHEGVTARRESSKLIIQKVQEIAGKQPVIVSGDFNCNQQSDPYQLFTNSTIVEDSFRKVNFPYGNNGTYNGFGKTVGSTEIIDHIFVSSHFSVGKWGILSDSYLGKYPSDHFPVMATLSLK